MLDEDQRKSPFKKFCQVNTEKDAVLAIDWLVKVSPLSYRILQFFVQHMDHYNALICSYKLLQERFEVSRASVANAIRVLREYQFIFAVKTGSSNVYLVNKTLYWNSWGSNYASAEFGVKLIVSLSEQSEATQRRIQKQLQTQRESHLKDTKRLPPLSDAVLEHLRKQVQSPVYLPSELPSKSKPKVNRVPIKLSPEEKRLLELLN